MEAVNLTEGGAMARKWFHLHLVLGVVTALSLTASVARAQTSEARDHINQLPYLERGAVLELMTSLMPPDSFEKRMEQVREEMLLQVRDVAARQNRPLPADASQRMQRAMKNSISYDEIVNLTAEAYVKHFSADEIRQIADFYQTPVGKKLARLQPEIMADIMPKINDTINQRVLKAMQREGLSVDVSR
jgi:hypothetical protein